MSLLLAVVVAFLLVGVDYTLGQTILCNYPTVCSGSTYTTYPTVILNGYKSMFGSSGSISGSASTVECGGAFSCSQVSFIESIDELICSGDNSCSESENTLYAANSLTCHGSSSCAYSQLSSNYTIECFGDQSCYSTIIEAPTSIIYASGAYSLMNSIIQSPRNDEMIDVNDSSIILYIDGYFAGYNATLTCYDEDICDIWCYGLGCYNFRINCHENATCNVNNCDESQSINCPIFINDGGNSDGFDDSEFEMIFDASNVGDLDDTICDNVGDSITYDDFEDTDGESSINPINGSVCCRGVDSCSNQNDITIDDPNMDIICSSEQGCYNNSHLITTLVGNGSLYCSGLRSCSESMINVSNTVYCGASESCELSTIYAKNVYCSASNHSCYNVSINGASNIYILTGSNDAFKESIINSNGVGQMNVYLFGYNAGNNIEINCEEGDSCLIECGTNGACSSVSTIINCDGICDVSCDEDNGIECPILISPTPTFSPTKMPSMDPTSVPTSPTFQPTLYPTLSPTFQPTEHPTHPVYDQKTQVDWANENETIIEYSTNIYPLSERNESYLSFTIPNGDPYCLTCILAWGDIDAYITVEDCGNVDDLDFGIINDNGDLIEAGSFYYCNGTWKLTASASLLTWQQTYGKFEIWEVDDLDRKYLQYRLEFQWNTSECQWYNYDTEEEESCDLTNLPLTSDTENTAMFSFSMPKTAGDNRRAPLIVVWQDLLGVPYALQPSLTDEWFNFTFTSLSEGDDMTFENIIDQFGDAILAASGFLLLLILFTIGATYYQGWKSQKKKRAKKRNINVEMIPCVDMTNSRMIIDNYPINKSVLNSIKIVDSNDINQNINGIVKPIDKIHRKSRFNLCKHGPWLFIVFVSRLMYMFIFTFTFMSWLFMALNDDDFDVLRQYSIIQNERDNQLINVSYMIEAYYNNESSRLEEMVEFREYYCYTSYINETAKQWKIGSKNQYVNHSTQMENAFYSINIDLNMTGQDIMYVYGNGDQACNINEDSGASGIIDDPYYEIIYVNESGSLVATAQYYYAYNYNRSITTGNYSFTLLEDKLNDVCDNGDWCEGWTWIDGINNGTHVINASYHFLDELGYPVVSNETGICYAKASYAESLFNFDNIESLINYTSVLEDEYLENYVQDVDDLINTFNKFVNLFTGDGIRRDEHPYDWQININIDNTAPSYDTDIDLDYFRMAWSSNAGLYDFTLRMSVTIDCPGCPDGNYTSPYLQQISDFLFNYNYSNISNFVDDVGGSPVNFSDLVTFDSSFFDYPDLPSIDLPFDIELPSLNFINWWTIFTLLLDSLLIIYRWTRTIGIVSEIARGKDVEISYKKIELEKNYNKKQCCDGNNISDQCLNCVIWCSDKFQSQFKICYNCYKCCWWLSWLTVVIISIGFILLAYVLVEQIISVEFIESLGLYDLLTISIAAQKSVRNQVISTTALGYNEYSLENMESSREVYASEKNSDAWDWNVDELSRVNEWNSYFCNSYLQYQLTTRDVTVDNNEVINIVSINPNYYKESFKNVFDQDSETYFQPTSNYSTGDDIISVIFELPTIQMTSEINCDGWVIEQIEFEWAYNSTSINGQNIHEIEYNVEIYDNDNLTWFEASLSYYAYTPTTTTSQSLLNEIQIHDIGWNETKYIRLNISSAKDWINAYRLNEITFYGHASDDCLACQKVSFYYWSFDASNDIDIELCPSVTPVHGIMYKGFVRSWLVDQLADAHRPFIEAFRNIILSPFAIAFIASIVLFFAYIFGLVIEYLLIKCELYRKNEFIRTPVVYTETQYWDETNENIENNNNNIQTNDIEMANTVETNQPITLVTKSTDI